VAPDDILKDQHGKEQVVDDGDQQQVRIKSRVPYVRGGKEKRGTPSISLPLLFFFFTDKQWERTRRGVKEEKGDGNVHQKNCLFFFISFFWEKALVGGGELRGILMKD